MAGRILVAVIVVVLTVLVCRSAAQPDIAVYELEALADEWNQNRAELAALKWGYQNLRDATSWFIVKWVNEGKITLLDMRDFRTATTPAEDQP